MIFWPQTSGFPETGVEDEGTKIEDPMWPQSSGFSQAAAGADEIIQFGRGQETDAFSFTRSESEQTWPQSSGFPETGVEADEIIQIGRSQNAETGSNQGDFTPHPEAQIEGDAIDTPVDDADNAQRPCVKTQRAFLSSCLPIYLSSKNKKKVDRSSEERARVTTEQKKTPWMTVEEAQELWNDEATLEGSPLVPTSHLTDRHRDLLQSALVQITHRITWTRAICNLVSCLNTPGHGLKDAELSEFHRLAQKNPSGKLWVTILASDARRNWIKYPQQQTAAGSECVVAEKADQIEQPTAGVLPFPLRTKTTPPQEPKAAQPPPSTPVATTEPSSEVFPFLEFEVSPDWAPVDTWLADKSNVNADTYNLWFKRLRPFKVTQSEAWLVTSNGFVQGWVENNFRALLERGLEESLGRSMVLRLFNREQSHAEAFGTQDYERGREVL